MTEPSKLQAGQPAPDFNCTDIFGNSVKLADYQHEKLLLCFFRYAGCPWCNLAIHRLTLAYPAFQELNLNVVAFIQSQPENIKHYIFDRHTPPPQFPIIADPERTVYDLYGVRDSLPAAARSLVKLPDWVQASFRKGFKQGTADGSLTLVPAQFLIERSSKIYKANYGVDYYDHLPIVEIMDFAQFGGQ
jgi:peroxiredoxin Q/BCP